MDSAHTGAQNFVFEPSSAQCSALTFVGARSAGPPVVCDYRAKGADRVAILM